MALLNEFLAFFAFGPLRDAIKAGGYHGLLSMNGLIAILAPVIPILLILELLFILAIRKFSINQYKVTSAIYIANVIIGKLLVLDVAAFVIVHFEKYALLKTGMSWYWFLYAYLVWELGQFIYHFASHKVRWHGALTRRTMPSNI